MPAPSIHIKFNPSLESLRTKFGELSIDNFLKNQVQKIAFEVERDSKRVTPVDTGALRASIGTSIGMGGFRAVIGPDVYYDFFVHEGTRYMKARPFMTWGAETATMGLEERLASDLDKLISSEIK